MLVLPPRALHWSPDTDEPSFVSSIASISSSDEVKRDLNTLASVRRSLLTGSDVEASIQRLQEYHANYKLGAFVFHFDYRRCSSSPLAPSTGLRTPTNPPLYHP
mmetsp:Transcript_22369/g.51254  ORF Transcript_22369/g.51254 Transcript_22369/m.51254 type:complete len:104 (-) Transcript_22369:122-433(-)